jgi:hypothetical protein
MREVELADAGERGFIAYMGNAALRGGQVVTYDGDLGSPGMPQGANSDPQRTLDLENALKLRSQVLESMWG